MQKSPSDNLNHYSNSTHRTLQRSSTLNRRYVTRPDSYTENKRRVVEVIDLSEPAVQETPAVAPAISHYARKISVIDSSESAAAQPAAQEPADLPPAKNPYQAAFDQQKAAETAAAVAHTPTARELKNLAIDQALQTVTPEAAPAKKSRHDLRAEKRAEKQAQKDAVKASKKQAKAAKKARKQLKSPHRGRRFALAFSCAAACIAVIGYFIYTNAPDLSVRVAAIQTGIDAKYPTYTPRDYQMSSVSTDPEGRVVIDFSGPNGDSYTLTEEKSTWDSNA